MPDSNDITATLSLPYIKPAQAQKHVTHNEALQLLDILVQLTVQDFGATTPPTTPVQGETWALDANPSGAWTGQGGSLASWRNGAWIFVTPGLGWRAWGVAQGEIRIFDGSDWTPLAGSSDPDFDNIPGVGINASSDANNRLAISSPATLLSHEGAGHQLKINKAGVGDTGSVLYQTNWSGRAEMGLAGNDDFAIKVSDDGASFSEALVADKATGQVRFPNGTAGSGSAAGPLGLQVVALVSERSVYAITGRRLSFGTGASTGPGPAMPFAGRVMAATLAVSEGSAGAGTTVGTTRVDVTINGVANTSYRVTIPTTGATVDTNQSDFTAAPLSFAAGDTVDLTISASNNSSHDLVGAIFVMFD